jgi:hypothetical protein
VGAAGRRRAPSRATHSEQVGRGGVAAGASRTRCPQIARTYPGGGSLQSTNSSSVTAWSRRSCKQVNHLVSGPISAIGDPSERRLILTNSIKPITPDVRID